MKIKQDPITKLWCREDGAVLMPPSHRGGMHFRWTFGCETPGGYRAVSYCRKYHEVHRLVCRAFHGLPPVDKPFVDHINRIRHDNQSRNLHWVSRKENQDNADRVDQSIERYRVRECEDKKAYDKAYKEVHHKRLKAYSKAYWAAEYAKKRAQGLAHRKGPDGKWGWFPRICAQKPV